MNYKQALAQDFPSDPGRISIDRWGQIEKDWALKIPVNPNKED